MFELKRRNRNTGNKQGFNLYSYLIVDNDNKKTLEWYYDGQRALYWRLEGVGRKSENFIVGRKSNPEIYRLINGIYKVIENSEYVRHDYVEPENRTGFCINRIDKESYHQYDNLGFFDKENKVIRCVSDKETDNADEVRIHQEEGIYRLEFIKNSKESKDFLIKFKIKESRYGNFFIPFCLANNDLGDIIREQHNERVYDNKTMVLRK